MLNLLFSVLQGHARNWTKTAVSLPRLVDSLGCCELSQWWVHTLIMSPGFSGGGDCMSFMPCTSGSEQMESVATTEL